MKHIVDLPRSISLHTFDVIGSTNEKAKEMSVDGAGDWTVIWSRAQNNGKGRFGKKWISPVGNLYLSILLKPNYNLEACSKISFLAAVAVKEAIKNSVIPESTISFKWPNDVLLNNKKVAGILLESSFKANAKKVDWLVVGVGINVKNFPENVDYPATSLENQGAENINVQQIMEKFIKSFIKLQKQFDDSGFAEIRKKWLESAEGKNKTIKIKTAQKIIAGTFKDIDEDGLLVIKTDDGKMKKISAGEVFFDNDGALNAAGN